MCCPVGVAAVRCAVWHWRRVVVEAVVVTGRLSNLCRLHALANRYHAMAHPHAAMPSPDAPLAQLPRSQYLAQPSQMCAPSCTSSTSPLFGPSAGMACTTQRRRPHRRGCCAAAAARLPRPPRRSGPRALVRVGEGAAAAEPAEVPYSVRGRAGVVRRAGVCGGSSPWDAAAEAARELGERGHGDGKGLDGVERRGVVEGCQRGKRGWVEEEGR